MSIDYESLLNPEQLRAVTTTSQHVRIIAGAGSGKTRVLTYRIAYLIAELHVDPYRILAVTFTNKAANEMKERVGKLVSSEAKMFLQVSTFHSFCARFLRQEAHLLGYPPSFTIFDDEDKNKLLKDIAEKKGYKKSDEIMKQALRYIDRKKMLGLYPEDIELNVLSFANEKECYEIYQEYEAAKERMLALDFDDLLLKTLLILRNFDAVREKWASRFQHILVDEFQDTNDVQRDLMMLLCSPQTNITVVGDPDQTIYTWRGANQGIILDFPDVFPDCEDIILNRNYRSTKNILDAANKLIAFNKDRVKKDLFTEADVGDKVIAKRFDDAAFEAKWVVEQIAKLATEDWPPEYQNIAILYRSSYMTRTIETELAANAIPYRIFGGLRFYQRREVKDVLAYFRLLLNPLDDVAFDRIVNVPKRSIGDVTLSRIHDEAEAAGASCYQYIQQIDQHPDTDISSKAINAILFMIQKMEATKAKLDENLETYSSVLKDFITDIGYYQYLAEEQDIDEDRAANVNSLFDDISAYISNNPESTFAEYLQNISILSSQDDMNGGNYVSMMTIHVAKGLEFDNVFIVSMNDGAFPSNKTITESGRKGMEEERRLAYVAMTRARKKLFLTCNSGFSYVIGSHQIPSPFLKEAGFDLPRPAFSASSFGGGQRPYGGGSKSSWRTVGFTQPKRDFFGDGDAISPFDDAPKPEEPKPKKPESNGISDWKVGDRVKHEKFGEGTVVQVISSSIITVEFDTQGKKSLLSTHPLLSRLYSKGGQA